MNLYQFARSSRQDGINVHTIGVDYSLQHRTMACEVHGVDEVFSSVDEASNDSSVDVLVLSHVLEHFSDLSMWLKKISRLLKNSGIMYVEVPGLEYLPNNPDYCFSLRQYFLFAHIYCFTLRSLSSTLSRYGFRLLHGDEEIRSVFCIDKRSGVEEPNPEVAESVFRCVETLAKPPYPWLSEALVAGRKGCIDSAALSYAYRALEFAPDMPWVHAVMADVFARKGDTARASASFLRALELGHPKPLNMLSLRIDQLVRLNDWELAWKACEDLAHTAPAWDNTATIKRAGIERLRGDADLALKIVSKIDDRDIVEPKAVFEEALAFEALGHKGKAGEILRRLEKRFPGNLELNSSLIRVLLKEDKIDDALQLTAAFPLSAANRVKWTLSKHALYLFGQKRFAAALKCVEESLRFDPNFMDSLLLKGGIMASMLLCDQAVEHFRGILNENPDKIDILLNISDAFRYRGRYAESMAVIDELERIAPDHSGIPITRAKVRAALGGEGSEDGLPQ